MAYLPLSTSNLPDPVIDPAQDASPEDYFNTVLYTGNGTARSITGVGFQPDMVWAKARNNTYNHSVHDVVRGVNNRINTNLTSQEYSDGAISSFDSDGFSFDRAGGINVNTTTFVAWNWKANGSGVSNTDGSITSTVSANTTSGFSIVSWTDVGNSADTIGHGLNQAPEFIVWKTRGTTGNWLVNVDISGTRYGLLLESTAASSAGNLLTAPTSSVISTWNQNTTMIAYCFHSVEGFSKFGSYTGNGSTDGPFVYTGFRPAFVLYKRTGGASSWTLIDSERSTSNPMGSYFFPDTSDAEGSNTILDFTSNGFKIRATFNSTNAFGETYIYMAFAEDGGAFKYSRAR